MKWSWLMPLGLALAWFALAPPEERLRKDGEENSGQEDRRGEGGGGQEGRREDPDHQADRGQDGGDAGVRR